MDYLKFLLFLVFVGNDVIGCSALTHAAHYIKLRQTHHVDSSTCLLLEETTTSKFKGFQTLDENELHVKSKPAIQVPFDSKKDVSDDSTIIEIFAKNANTLKAHVNLICSTINFLPTFRLNKERQQEPEVQKIVHGGDPNNRIDVVFMGDGYTAEERDKFFEDMRRLTSDMFEGVTFKSYLPVFNIWAIYVESEDSGIGYNGPINTPFQLYREEGQLRVIWPGNREYAREVCTLTGPSGCDYPSLIANDDYYGGLGGEFVISTRSNRTGTMVLRHEMGHNFADVGDEYDNSWAYFGANSATRLDNIGWRVWLSEPTLTEQRAVYRLLEYPWFDLSLGNQTFEFTSDGTYSRWYLRVSVSAAGESDSLEFALDGQVLPWTSSGFDDREFYDWEGTEGFSPGTHILSVRSKTNPTHPDIPRMICSATLHEMGNEEEFHEDNSFVSAYPTFDDQRRKTLRPTNEGCLMRNMSHSEFCSICRESMWLQFLSRISLIDSLEIGEVPNPDGTTPVTLNTLKLAHLRNPGNEIPGEELTIQWFLDELEMIDYQNYLHVNATSGSWRVDVNFATPEVRSDPQGHLRDSEEFEIS